MGYQVWENGCAASDLLVLEVLFAAVFIIIMIIIIMIIIIIAVVAVVVVVLGYLGVMLELVHQLILPEPLDGLLAVWLEAAGENALLGDGARHSHI